ncbi:MAG: HAMP domain-containing sensor histidine kinase [Chloroflexota bacterium]
MLKLQVFTRVATWTLLAGWVGLTVWVLVATWLADERLLYVEAGSPVVLVWVALTPLVWMVAWGIRSAPSARITEPGFYRVLAEKTGDALLVYTADEQLVWANTAARSLFPASLPIPANVALLASRAHKHGSIVRQIVPVEGAGRFNVQVVPVDEDHTALIVRAANLESGRSKFYENFIRRIVHDMRNPLAAIIGHAANLRGMPSPDAAQVERSAETIENEAQRLARLVDSMLFDARLAYVPLAPEPLDLIELVEEAMYTLEERTTDTAKQITLEMPPMDAQINGDRDLLLRAFENLLDNGLKYTGPDGRVLVRLQHRAHGYDLAFIDNGQGIPPEFLPDRIFEPLVRATSGPGGSGLGLSIVKKIIEMHGGTITAQSEVGRGTAMKLYLPAGSEEV